MITLFIMFYVKNVSLSLKVEPISFSQSHVVPWLELSRGAMGRGVGKGYREATAWLGSLWPVPLATDGRCLLLSLQISLMMNFQPPSKAWRASQMMTFFIFLLFFPSFTGVLCTLAITIWR